SVINFTSIQNLQGGSGDNKFNVGNSGSLSGNLTGGGGGNLLSYAAYTGNVLVNLQTATATAVNGSVTNIQNVTGGSGGPAGSYNILVGNGGNELRGGNGRRNLLIAGPSSSKLYGGDDEDILIAGYTDYDASNNDLTNIMLH